MSKAKGDTLALQQATAELQRTLSEVCCRPLRRAPALPALGHGLPMRCLLLRAV
jgi:hypothetical protein